MAYFTKRYHPPGTAPGVLTADRSPAAPGEIMLTHYDGQGLSEKSGALPAECAAAVSHGTVTWVHVQGRPDPAMLQALGTGFGLHPLALEDVLNTGQRPKSETYDGQLFVVASMPAGEGDRILTEQVSLFLGDGFVISFHEGAADPFGPVRRRLRAADGRIRVRKADYLLYALLDVVIDRGFPLLEDFGERVEDLEEELVDVADRSTLSRIHELKRDLLLLRRMLWPQREALSGLMRDGHALIKDETKIYLRDCYDHTIQIMDLLETYRDMTASMLDVYLSSVSNRLNEVMRVLTVIATIFMPLTFIVGIYGMNFGADTASPWAMPELHWYYGYPLLWLVMISVAAGMWLYFRRKGWL